MASIFISYRRADTEADTGRLYDSLMSRLPEARIFMDIDSLQPGEDFVERLKKTLSSAEVVLVVIGRAWLTASDGGGHRRLENPEDLVRQEIANALQQHAHVIPVLVQGAVMPSEHDLPNAVRSLARRQAVELRHTRWGDDVHHLVERIEHLVDSGVVRHEHASLGDHRRWSMFRPLARRSGVVVLTVVVVSSIGLWRLYGPTAVPMPTTPLARTSEGAGSPATPTERPSEVIAARPPAETQDAREGQKQPSAAASARRRGRPTSAPVATPRETPPDRDLPAEARSMPRDDVAAQHAAIEAVLDRYAAGYSRRDPAAIRRVWPSAPEGLARELADSRSYRVELIDSDIVLEGDTARVTCVRQVTARLAVGREQSRSVQTVISLRRGPGGWLITDVR